MRSKGFQAPGLDAAAGRLKGRGATGNPASRFLVRHSEPVSDGWHAQPSGDVSDPLTELATSSIHTQLFPDRTRELITRNQSPDVPFDRSINPYKGCEHGCVYCFARPTHAYLDLSPGLDFETRIFYKTNVRDLLTRSLGKSGYRCRTIAMGTNTDPYQPAEREQRVTRTVLEVLLEHRHPVSILTKGQLILRDLDLLTALAEQGLVSVALSVTTLDDGLKARLEPRAASGAARLRVLERLAAAGIPTSAMLAPVIPFVNDHEIEAIVAAAARTGVQSMNYILLRLPLEVAGLFRDWLDAHYPLKAERVMSAIRASRGGKDYDPRWGKRLRGEGAIADLIGRRFAAALRRNDLAPDPERTRRHALRTDLFRAAGSAQLDLFG